MAEADIRAELMAASYEAEILATTLTVALESLQTVPEAGGVEPQLTVVLKLSKQLGDLLDRIKDLLREHFAPATQ